MLPTVSSEFKHGDNIAVVEDVASCTSCTDSSLDEFDLEQFRNSSVVMTNSISTHSKQPINKPDKKDKSFEKESIHILGFTILMKYLNERHKDPIFLLKFMLFLYIVGSVFAVITFVYGSNYDVVLSITGILLILFVLLYTLVQLRSSVKDGVKIHWADLPYIAAYIAGYTTVILYSFLVKTPFDSIPLYLLGVFAIGLFYQILSACAQTKSNVSKNDPNYQLKFFIKRTLLGFMNAAGAIDVLSDIALGVQIIRSYQGYLRYSGIVMFICCVLDFVIVNVRIIMPGKVTYTMHMWAIVLEVFIILLSVLAAAKSIVENVGWEFVLLLTISFATTLINFSHHLLVLVEWRMAIIRRNQVISFAEVLE